MKPTTETIKILTDQVAALKREMKWTRSTPHKMELNRRIEAVNKRIKGMGGKPIDGQR